MYKNSNFWASRFVNPDEDPKNNPFKNTLLYAIMNILYWMLATGVSIYIAVLESREIWPYFVIAAELPFLCAGIFGCKAAKTLTKPTIVAAVACSGTSILTSFIAIILTIYFAIIISTYPAQVIWILMAINAMSLLLNINVCYAYYTASQIDPNKPKDSRRKDTVDRWNQDQICEAFPRHQPMSTFAPAEPSAHRSSRSSNRPISNEATVQQPRHFTPAAPVHPSYPTHVPALSGKSKYVAVEPSTDLKSSFQLPRVMLSKTPIYNQSASTSRQQSYGY